MQDLELVRHLARATARTTDLDGVLRVALEVVCDHMDAAGGIVWRPESGQWRVRHQYPTTDEAPAVPPVVSAMLATGSPSSLWRGPRGHSVVAVTVGGSGRPVAVLQVSLDRTVSVQPLLALCETSAELLTRVVERAGSQADLLEAQQLARMGSWQCDAASGEIRLSDHLFANLGLGAVDLDGGAAALLGLVHAADRDDVERTCVRALSDLQPFEVTFRTDANSTGQERWLQVRGRVVTDADLAPVRIVGTAQDVTERLELQQELDYRATYDVLTGLANRSAFQDHLERMLASGVAGTVAVAVVDVDRFGRITKELARGSGDHLLRAIAERLPTSAPPDALVARLVGDEFAVAVTDTVPGPDVADELGARLLAAFDLPFELDGHLQRLSASIGIVATASGRETADDLLRDAAMALELAKTRGGGRAQVFDQQQHTHALEQLALEADLRQAIDQGDLRLAYQPVVDLSRGSMVATEALVRWDRRGHGPMSPAVFVPLAEQLGLAGRLGSQVLLAACNQLAAWHREFPEAADLSVAVNISAVQLDDPSVVSMVEEALQRSGISPEHLTLEVTESALPDDAAGALARLWALRRLGVCIAIDDFGTGYSTLSRLRELPVDVLKIDRSFLADTGRDAPILQALFAMARTLGLDTVTEGVETPEQLQAVLDNHGHHVQGYLFARPLPPEGVARLLRDPDWDTDEMNLVVEIADVPTDTPTRGAETVHLNALFHGMMSAVDRDGLDRRLRDLLAAVAETTHMDAVYLTRVDLEGQRQDIEVVAGTGELAIVEGSTLSWSDALCRRALLDDRNVIHDVAADYPDVSAAIDLGIATFAVAPVRNAHGGLYGTICAAGAEPHSMPEAAAELLTLVAGLVAERVAELARPTPSAGRD